MSMGDPEYTKSLAESVTYKGVVLEEVPGMRQRITLLEAQNKRLREALQRTHLYVPEPFCDKDDCLSSLCQERRSLHAEIQALLAEPQPAESGKANTDHKLSP